MLEEIERESGAEGTTTISSDDFRRIQFVANKNGLSIDHLLKKTGNTPLSSKGVAPPTNSVVSFFSGCGGMDLGFRGGFKYKTQKFEKLPFEILAAYDHDQKCVDTYNLNISNHAEVRDLSSFDPADIPSADVLIGGFPCQEFSVCGPRKGLSSARGGLYLAMTNYARYHKPKIIIGENVPGIAILAKGEALKKIIGDVEKEGYRVNIWKLFAPDYGVPQTRSRIFFICVRNDLKGSPNMPEPSHYENHRSIKWAIDDLTKIHDETVNNQSQYFRALVATGGSGQGDEISRADSPGFTVRANARSRVQFHYTLNRRLTIRECARLQTFPDNFLFPFSKTTNQMQVGNAVPPMLGHVVATSVSNWLNGS
jgi:DNA (cytosine-5)-methyltransferase 1